jgi:hypothetical protein
VVVELVGPVADDRRFLASATAPVAADFTVRAADAALFDPALTELVALARAGFGDAVLLEEAPAGFRAAAVVDAVVPTALFSAALLGEDVVLLDGAAEVRRAVVEDVEERFFSSSETEGWLRCEVVDAEVGGRLVTVETEPGGGRVGSLFRPPAEGAVREDELAVGFGAALPGGGTLRRAGAEPVAGGFFAVAVGDFGLDELGAAAGSDVGASVCCTTSKPSVSDMLGNRDGR